MILRIASRGAGPRGNDTIHVTTLSGSTAKGFRKAMSTAYVFALLMM
jgi:hypothetical protein